MLDVIMPTTIKKRRVVFLPDKTWKLVLELSNKDSISASEALRRLLEERHE